MERGRCADAWYGRRNCVSHRSYIRVSGDCRVSIVNVRRGEFTSDVRRVITKYTDHVNCAEC
jgi:hypothetical protein